MGLFFFHMRHTSIPGRHSAHWKSKLNNMLFNIGTDIVVSEVYQQMQVAFVTE